MLDERYIRTAVEAAHAAGAVLRQWSDKFSVREKGPANLVTEADLAAQDAIVRCIRAQFPEHGLLGEEDLDQPQQNQPFRWIIDPLDGTSNYVHGFPYYAVSIGLEFEGNIILGMIFDPNRDEIFTAQRGQGASLNGRRIRPSVASALDQAFVVASLPNGIEADDPAVERLLRILPHAQTVQRTGSAALNLAYVACGRMDAFWSTSLKPWDVAAGSLIVTEAGGIMSQINGDDFDHIVPNLLCANGLPVHRQLVKLLTETSIS